MGDETFTVTAPHTSHDAAVAVEAMRRELDRRRTFAGKHANTRAKCKHLHKRERAKAHLQIEAPNAEKREAQANEWPLSGDVKVEAAAVAEAMGMDGYVPQTVGDLEWMRERSESLAETWRDRAFDARKDIEMWVMVAAMSKQEAALGLTEGVPA